MFARQRLFPVGRLRKPRERPGTQEVTDGEPGTFLKDSGDRCRIEKESGQGISVIASIPASDKERVSLAALTHLPPAVARVQANRPSPDIGYVGPGSVASSLGSRVPPPSKEQRPL